MATTSSIKQLQLSSGSPSAYASVSQNIAKQIPQNVPDLETARLFGSAVTDLLKQYQGIEKYPYAAQGFNAREEQVKRLSFTDPELVGAAPSVQSAARQASTAAVQPTISGASEAGQTFASRLQTLGDVINAASSLQQTEENRALQAKSDAQNLINNAITNFGPDAFNGLNPKELERIEKMAGFPSGYVAQVAKAIKSREVAQQAREEELIRLQKSLSGGGASNKQPIMDDYNKVIGYFNPDTGQTIYYNNQETAQGDDGFKQFVTQQEKQAGQSFSPQKIEQLRTQYKSTQSTQTQSTQIPKSLLDKGYVVVDSSYSNATQLPNGLLVAKLKPLTDTAATKLSQFTDVTSQIENIKNYATQAGFFDPIAGTFRNINPYDAKAQQLNRMITSVVPSLARGVFGEVGVLTDKDVERYTKLLPNIKTPASQVTEALNFIVSRIDNSYNNYLNTYKKAGYDVRDFDTTQSNQSANMSGVTSGGLSYKVIQ